MKLFAYAALLVSLSSAHAGVLDRSKGFVSQLLEIGKQSRESKGVLNSSSRKLVRDLSGQVDFEALAAKSLGAKWKQIKPETRKDFLATLQQTIETLVYPRADRISAPLNEVKFSTKPSAPRRVVARTKFETEKQGELIERDLEFELIFDTREKVVDAIIEGEMVSANLKRQFDQALKKKTFDQLLAQMKERVAKEQKKGQAK